MLETGKIASKIPTTSELTLVATLSAAYVVSTFFPITVYIGGAAFITLEIVMLPVISALLRPVPATIAIFFGSLGMAVFQTGIYHVFGFLGLLVPIVAVVCGSVAFHSRYGAILPWSYVLFGAFYYVAYSEGGTLLWLVPYMLVIASLPITLRASGRNAVVLLSFYVAMAEQATLNILSISVVGLVDGVWSVITPFMLLERTIATFGGAGLVVALKSRLDTRLFLSQRLREVR